jgi:ERCC4-type nuclease
MIIKLDIRESELISLITEHIKNVPAFKQLELKTESLPLGDVIINDGTKDLIIIERKSIRDLAASIKDGRYEEQSYRLNGIDHHNHNIIYLIEGDLNKPVSSNFRDKIDKLTIFSAITSLSLYKGFSVIRTMNINETSIFICNTANKMRKNINEKKKLFYGEDLVVETPNIIKVITDPDKEKEQTQEEEEIEEVNKEKAYVNVVKKVKKDNVTPDNIGEIMLSQIPGISSVSALALISHFKNITNLINEIQKDSSCLEKVTYTTNKNQIKKISKPCIANILKYLVDNKT